MNQLFLGVVPKVCPIFILHIKIKVEVFLFFLVLTFTFVRDSNKISVFKVFGKWEHAIKFRRIFWGKRGKKHD